MTNDRTEKFKEITELLQDEDIKGFKDDLLLYLRATQKIGNKVSTYKGTHPSGFIPWGVSNIHKNIKVTWDEFRHFATILGDYLSIENETFIYNTGNLYRHNEQYLKCKSQAFRDYLGSIKLPEADLQMPEETRVVDVIGYFVICTLAESGEPVISLSRCLDLLSAKVKKPLWLNVVQQVIENQDLASVVKPMFKGLSILDELAYKSNGSFPIEHYLVVDIDYGTALINNLPESKQIAEAIGSSFSDFKELEDASQEEKSLSPLLPYIERATNNAGGVGPIDPKDLPAKEYLQRLIDKGLLKYRADNKLISAMGKTYWSDFAPLLNNAKRKQKELVSEWLQSFVRMPKATGTIDKGNFVPKKTGEKVVPIVKEGNRISIERELKPYDIKYGLLSVAGIRERFPDSGKTIIVCDDEGRQYTGKMHSSQPRIDGLTAWHKNHSTRVGDILILTINPDKSIKLSKRLRKKESPAPVEVIEGKIQEPLIEEEPSALIARQAQHAGLNIFLGLLKNNNEKIFWRPGSLNNGHFILIGGSGAGKTETIRCIESELARQGFPVLLIDFHGDMACGNCPVKTHAIKEDSEFFYNPLALDPSFGDITPLRATSDFVDAMFINFPSLGVQQKDHLKGMIKNAYEIAGVTNKKESWTKELKFEDIENAIRESDDQTTQTIRAYLNDIFDYQLFSGQTEISINSILSESITHINLKALPESLKFLYADLFLRKLYYSVQSLGEIPRGNISDKEKFKLFVIVDEAKLLVSEKQGTKAVLNKYATELRKYGVGLILASQLIGHFTDEILSNVAIKLCMKAEDNKQAKANSKFFGASEKDLINLEQGGGILIVGGDRKNIRIVPTWNR